MRRSRTPLGLLGTLGRLFARRPAVCRRCPWLEFCGRATVVVDAGAATAGGLRDVVVTFRVVHWHTAPVAKFVIVQLRLREVDLPPGSDFLVRVTLPRECAALTCSQLPHRSPVTTVVAGLCGADVEVTAHQGRSPSHRTGIPAAA